MKTRFKSLAAASAVALAAFGMPQLALADDHGDHAAHAEATGPALWQLTDEDTTIYMFGTIHVLPEGLDWLQPTVQTALESSDQYVSEIDTSLIPDFDPASGQAPPPEIMEIAQMQMALAQLTTGGTLRDLMNEEDRGEYEAAMASLGMPAQAFDGFEPWFAAMTMMQLYMMQSGLNPSDGVEMVLDGYVEGKDRAAFETVEQQMGFFDNLPIESQLQFLDEGAEALVEEGAMTAMFQEMVDAWMAGNPDQLAAVVNDSMSDPILYDVLLSQRNAEWANWIDDRMDQPGTVFIAVGAGHLGGENSVQDYLAERGLTVERVQY
ncbi:TraB/GumN family protein [Aurantiacibacter gangjinensis]|uniref:Uncharacterized protein n=1 Tax=Aurantiacibacter gangjinensis TaxID=502682 RepID=A0A0G9MQ65_9SPHN|nr:TraB/GumN family protein [Aurantiacibacter gangjinensis]APE28715.1 hypothetical protein BMF35_a1886 [Aurantiacibacter gangjinensis]KLE32876.1 hypothetical protein AAW01_02325 [Aurantiacibacter gangjinensis]